MSGPIAIAFQGCLSGRHEQSVEHQGGWWAPNGPVGAWRIGSIVLLFQTLLGHLDCTCGDAVSAVHERYEHSARVGVVGAFNGFRLESSDMVSG